MSTPINVGGALIYSRSDEWYTPPHVFTALGLTFDLDPCAPEGGVPWVPAEEHFSQTDGGLTQPWHGRVWLNPPYGSQTGEWVSRLAKHGNGVALVFARTDTEWGQNAIACADAVCFIARRLAFIAGGGQEQKGHNAGAPSMLLAFGDECAAAVRDCKLGLTFSADHLVGHPAEASLFDCDSRSTVVDLAVEDEIHRTSGNRRREAA